MTEGIAIRVLLIEDSPTDALLLRELLADNRLMSSDVTEVDRLSAGIDELARVNFDIVLLDLGLPDSSGVATFARLHAVVPQVPVLVLTAMDDETVGIDAVQAGAQDYLVKQQVESRWLARSIRYAIERHRISRELARRAQELAESEERFELAVNGTDAGLWDCDLRTEVCYFAPRFRQLLGYSETDDFPTSLRVVRNEIHPEDQERATVALQKHLGSGIPYRVEYRIRTKIGSFRWVQSRGQALWGEDGRPFRMVGWIIDMTERKRDEEALRQSKASLRLLTARIQAVREEERTRISRVVHDQLGQMLTGLKMDLRWLDRRMVPDETLPRVREMRDRILTAEVLVDETIATVQRVAVELRPGVLDQFGLNEAIRDEARRYERRTGTSVIVTIGDEIPPVPGAMATEYFRILQELFTNITRHAQADRVSVEFGAEQGNFVLRVGDNGKGFDANETLRTTSLGLLGMSERAVSMGGWIDVDAQPGHGSRFTVSVPLR